MDHHNLSHKFLATTPISSISLVSTCRWSSSTINTNSSFTIHHFWILLPHILHTTFVARHPHRMCHVVSASNPHKGHKRSFIILWQKRFAFVAKALWHALNINTFTTWGTLIFQIFFQRKIVDLCVSFPLGQLLGFPCVDDKCFSL
jgi:hypothetical protein